MKQRSFHFCLFSLLVFSTLLLGFVLQSTNVARAEIDGRVGYTALPAMGRGSGIAHVEIFPYQMLNDEAILFGDFRGFISEYGKLGGNFGGGFRFLEPNEIFLLGINGFYDVDQTSGTLFHQVGFGLEAMTRFGGITSNLYFPVGNDTRLISEQNVDARFMGDGIMFDKLQVLGGAARGFDLMGRVFVPGEFASKHNLELAAGWYQFGNDQVESINGFKLQAQGEIVPSLNAEVAYTNDGYFGSKVTLGLSWRFGNRGLEQDSVDRQLRRFVDRNYNIVVGEFTHLSQDQRLTKADGTEYVVHHIQGGATGGDGSIDNPYSTIADAQAGADIIFVHGGTTLTESIQLQDNQMLLGAGVEHALNDLNNGIVTLASDLSPGGIPTMLNATGNAVVMGNNSRIAGFVIDSPNGSGIVSNGKTGFEIFDVAVHNAGAHGIFINNATSGSLRNVTIDGGSQNGLHVTNTNGDLTFENLAIRNLVNDGVRIDAGKGNLDFVGDLEFENIAGNSFHISRLFTTTVIDDKGTTITTDDETIVTEGTVNIEKITIDTASGGVGILIDDNDGLVSIDNVDITSTDGTALVVKDSDRVYIGSGDITATGSTGVTGINVENSRVDLRLTSLNVDGGTNAIRMANSANSSRLIVFGEEDPGSGGTIKNTDVAVLMENSNQLGLQLVAFTDNDAIANISNSNHFEIGSSTITGTKDYFIKALNTKRLAVISTDFNYNNSMLSDTGLAFDVNQAGSYAFSFQNNQVDEGPRRLIHMQTLAGGESASMNYTYMRNTVVMDDLNGVASQVNWTGTFQGDFRSNLTQGTADNQTAFHFDLGQSNNNSALMIQNNGFAMAGDFGRAILVDNEAALTGQILQNIIEFKGKNGTGMDLSVHKASTFNISQNQITENANAGGSRGILFNTIYDQSIVVFNGNKMDLAGSVHLEQGLLFQAVNGPTSSPQVRLISTENNIISGADNVFSVPASGFLGYLFINGEQNIF